MKKFFLSFRLVFFFIAHSSFSQLTVTDGLTAQQLAENLSGPNISVFNASLTGGAAQSGSFNFTGSNFGIESGVLLTSGRISNAIGPNNSSSTSWINGGPGTPQLDNVAGITTYDAITLKFDFTVQSSAIKFDYIFASEEYNEYVGSLFNDVFAFYISGPGINGEENIALVPNTTDPVTINNINLFNYWQFYRNNEDANTNIQFDGFTSLLTAKKEGLIPCNTYTLKLVIADAGDGVWDSGVFLKKNSLVQELVSAVANTVTQDQIALEGCYDASFTFNLDKPQATNTVISYLIGGTAVNGVDYKKIDSSVIIPAGQTSATIVIDAYADGIPETQETVELKYRPTPCAPYNSIILYIDDNQPIDFLLSKTDLLCYGDHSGKINANITGGFGPYKITLNNETTYNALPITNLSAGTYQVKVDDKYGCGGDAKVVGAEFDAGTTFLPDGNGNVYSTSLAISGFGASETLATANQLQSLCLTLEHSFMGDVEMKLIAPDAKTITLKERPGGNNVNFGEPVASGPVDTNSADVTPGKGYQYCFSNTPVYGTMVEESKNNYTYDYIDNAGNQHGNEKYLPSGGYQPYQSFEGLVGAPLNGNWTIQVKDYKPNDNGYIFKWSISFTSGNPGNVVVINQPQPIAVTGGVTKAACGVADGAINISATGPNTPFTYLWSNNAITEDINGLAAGSYTVTVKNSSNCTSQSTFLVSNAGALTINAVASSPSCFQNNTGLIDATIVGGSGNYSYLWSNGATTQDVNNITAGDYTLATTDNTSGCIALSSITVTQPTELKIASAILNEKCGDREGSISVTATGGNGGYQYTWNNGLTTSSIQNLQTGNYSVNVTDSKACSLQKTFSIINEVGDCLPNCDLAINNNNLSNETCGHANGSIDLSISTTNGPYTTSWSNGSASEDLINLKEGIYSVNVTDKAGCKVAQSFTILNSTGTLSAGIPIISNEKCGDGKGSINISPSGGTGNVTFVWSNGATTEDVNNIKAGTYSVIITDQSGCSITKAYLLENESGTLTQTFGNAVNEVCGNHKGSIDITIKGGVEAYTYQWSNGATSQDLINLSAGVYNCTIKDKSGCSISTPQYTIKNEAGSLAISFIDVDNELCDNNEGSVELYITGGVNPSYNWSNNVSGTKVISHLNDGTYSCLITDNNGCSLNTGNIIVSNESGTLKVDNIFIQHEQCGNGSGAIDVAVSGGSGIYTYQWSNGATTQDLNGLHTGNYSCVIKDTQGCSVNISVIVTNTAGTLSVSDVGITNDACGIGTGAVNLTIQGGATPYSFLWSNGNITEDIVNQRAGVYSCKITDKNGCITTSSGTIQGSSQTIDQINITHETCGLKNGSISLAVSGGTGNHTYIWSNGAAGAKISQLSAGLYSCNITDGNNCTLTSPQIIVNGNSGNLVASANATVNTTCHTANIQLTVSGGTAPYKYSWSTGATTQNISVSSIGTFLCVVTDANGLCASTSAVVGDLGGVSPLLNVNVYDDYCGTGQGEIYLGLSTGVYSYMWSNGKTTKNIFGLSEGTYTCTITSQSGCIYTATGVVKSFNSNPLKATYNITHDVCGNHQGSIDLTITGGTPQYYYEWYNSNYEYLGSTQDVAGLGAGIYFVYVWDDTYFDNYCYLYQEITITGNSPLQVNNTQITNDNCNKNAGAINLTIAGGTLPYNFLWSNNSVTEDISGVVKGVYSYTITDANNCTIQSTAEVKGYNSIVITGIVKNDVCSKSKGEIDISVTGGTGSFSYLWNNNATTQDIANINIGNYLVTVTDNATNCKETLGFVVDNNPGTLIHQIIATKAICGLSNGSVDLTVAGGSGNYTYEWNSAATTQDLTNVSPAIYTCKVTDASDGCSFIAQAEVLDQLNVINILQDNLTDDLCNTGKGKINVTVSGGVNTFLYKWSNGATSEDLQQLHANDYTLAVKSGSTCLAEKQFHISNVTNGFAIQSLNSISENCGNSTGSIDLTMTGGSGNYSYAWSSGQTTEDLSKLRQGIYTVTATDADWGCIETASVAVNNITGTLSQMTFPVNEICSNHLGAVDLKISGGSGNYSYAWSNGATTEDLSNLSAGNFTCDITDQSNNCILHAEAYIQNVQNSISISMTSTDEVCDNSKGAIILSISEGSGNFSYRWSNGSTTKNLSGLKAGIYTCYITDLGNGCVTHATGEVINQPNTLSISVSQLNEDCNDGKGEIQISVSGGYGSKSFKWSTGDVTEDLSNLHEGNYTLVVTDEQRCIVEKTVTILNSAPFNISHTTIVDATCAACTNGKIDLTLSEVGPFTYKWSTGKTSEDISDLAPGAYEVAILKNVGSKECTVNQTFDVGVKPQETDILNLYPNPSVDGIIYLGNPNGEGEVEVNVSDMLGQKVYSKNLFFSGEKLLVDLSSLANGTYTMELIFNSEKTLHKILITK